ncbi:Non-specific serine/threonine protein kinase [Bertholletia excelsa]
MAAVRLLFLFLSLFLLPFSLSVPETEALLKFKASLTNTKALDSWVPNSAPCKSVPPWAGIMCNNGVMTGLHLAKMDLSGKIDIDALLEIPTLRTITLVNNQFSGPIPDFNRIGFLKALYLSFNSFSGEIPPDFFTKMGSLKRLWLSDNKFAGKIPDSLGKIPTLIELRLERNEFSGPIPLLEQKSLTMIDLSNNKLEGEIPQTMSRFGPNPFQGNPGLCGEVVNKQCVQPVPSAIDQDIEEDDLPVQSQPDTQQQESSSKLSPGWIVLAVIATLLLVVVLLKAKNRKRENQFARLSKEEDVVAVGTGPGLASVTGIGGRTTSSNRRSVHSSSQKGTGGSTRKGSQHGGKSSMGDLVVVNEEKGVFGLSDLMKAAAEVLGNGGLGSAYKALMGNGLAVVVKRVREMNKMSKDVFDAEIRRLAALKHPNILAPLAYHYRREEKLLVSEHVCNGSLLYTLHGDRGVAHAELDWPTRLKIIKGVARGMEFLHSKFATYQLPHGNLKSSNILLDSNYEPLLSDYAFYPLVNNTQAIQAMFAFKSPEAILYQQLSPKSDVYCLGIVILEVLTGKFPSQYLSNQKGGIDVVQWVRSAVSESREAELIDPEIAIASNSVAEMVKLLHVGAACTESEPEQRIDMKEAIRRIEEIHV